MSVCSPNPTARIQTTIRTIYLCFSTPKIQLTGARAFRNFSEFFLISSQTGKLCSRTTEDCLSNIRSLLVYREGQLFGAEGRRAGKPDASNRPHSDHPLPTVRNVWSS